MSAAISFSDRLLAVGMTGSGKSELLRYLFSQVRARRVLVDPKGEWSIDGVTPVNAWERVDWEAPIIHVRPRWGDRDHLTDLWERVDALRGDLLVWTDEAYGVSTSSWAPAKLLSHQTAGRSRGHGHFVATQRPRNVAKELVTEADHLLLFPPVDVEDLREARRGMAFLDQDRAVELMKSLPRYGYLWANKKTQRIALGPPLPPELRASGTVRRRTL